MKDLAHSKAARRAAGWLLGLTLLFTGLHAAAQQDPPGRVARLGFHQGTVSFSPAGDHSWYDVVPNRPLTTGDRLWTDRNARAELQVGSTVLRMDEQTGITISELDDDTARITAQQGRVQLRVRDDLADQRFEIGTGNAAFVIDAPGDYRVDADPAGDTTRVAIAAGNATLYGEGGESVPLGARQQLTVAGRNLSSVSGAPAQAGAGFERWAAERDRAEEQSISARYVSRDVVGYQQLDSHGDWQNDASYGNVWYPRNVDAEWAPYRDGQWVNVSPWGWTWVDAAPWGFAPSHYGRWARIGPRWGWVPGRPSARSVYAPALVGFVGGGGANANFSIGGGRNGVGWFPLAPGEAWRPGYRASQNYIDQANRAGIYNRQIATRNAEFAHQRTPGAVTVVPVDVFGRGPLNRRDFVRLSEDRMAGVQVGTAVPVPLRGDRGWGGIGRPAAALPPAEFQGRQQPFQPGQQREAWRQQGAPLQGATGFESYRPQDAVRQQQQNQQRAAQAQAQQGQQMQQAQQMQQMQQMQQREGMRQQQEFQQRAAQAQAQQQMQLQQQQQQMQVQQQQQALRQQQEMQQRSVQAQQLQMQQQQAMRVQQMQALQQQQQAQQAQQIQQMQQMHQNNTMRQAQEVQQRAAQQQQQREQQLQRAGIRQSGDRP